MRRASAQRSSLTNWTAACGVRMARLLLATVKIVATREAASANALALEGRCVGTVAIFGLPRIFFLAFGRLRCAIFRFRANLAASSDCHSRSIFPKVAPITKCLWRPHPINMPEAVALHCLPIHVDERAFRLFIELYPLHGHLGMAGGSLAEDFTL